MNPADTNQIQADQFLVCGLGCLGQHCVAVLKKYGVHVSAIDITGHQEWEIGNLPGLLDRLVIGDCRLSSVLREVNIRKQRAILLVTGDDKVNYEAAFEARSINPHIRLVIRSAKSNFNDLLSAELGNFVAFEPTELSAPAFAQVALGDQMPACFFLENRMTKVIRRVVGTEDAWVGEKLKDLDNRSLRVLMHRSGDAEFPDNFYKWDPAIRIRPGDMLVYVENEEPNRTWELSEAKKLPGLRAIFTKLSHFYCQAKRKISRFAQKSLNDQIHRVAILCGLTILLLLVSGGFLFHFFGPGMQWTDSFYATFVLLLGGYADLLGSQLKFRLAISWWLRLFSLMLTLIGTVFVGVIYALMTQRLIGTRFKFSKRPSVPEKKHVVVVGFGMIGKRVLSLMREFGEEVIGVSVDDSAMPKDASFPQLTVAKHEFDHALKMANLATAKSVITVTRDDLDNLEMALMAHRVNAGIRMVIRTYHPRFGENMGRLFPKAHVLCVSALSAEAFAAAAFGEKVPHLFRLNDQTVIVTEYNIEQEDTLNGLILSEIAYGYGVVPILHQRPTGNFAQWMPSDNIRLEIGDRLFVLATTEGLRRIEKGQLLPRRRMLRINKTTMPSAKFEGANVLARLTGCDLGLARNLMENLPAEYPVPVYLHQGYMIVKTLRKNMIDAELVTISDSNAETRT